MPETMKGDLTSSGEARRSHPDSGKHFLFARVQYLTLLAFPFMIHFMIQRAPS